MRQVSVILETCPLAAELVPAWVAALTVEESLAIFGAVMAEVMDAVRCKQVSMRQALHIVEAFREKFGHVSACCGTKAFEADHGRGSRADGLREMADAVAERAMATAGGVNARAVALELGVAPGSMGGLVGHLETDARVVVRQVLVGKRASGVKRRRAIWCSGVDDPQKGWECDGDRDQAGRAADDDGQGEEPAGGGGGAGEAGPG